MGHHRPHLDAAVIIYTGGTFDLLHTGHIELLRWLKTLPALTQVYVSLNTDEFIESYKGRPPINSYAERYEMLSAIKWVDMVIPNTGGADSREAIEHVSPDIVAIGSDWHHPKDYLSQMGLTWEWLHEHRISILYVPRLTTTPSTTLKKAKLEDDLRLDPRSQAETG